MLMAIQLPDDLVIAARRIEVLDRGPKRVRHALPVDRVEMPVNAPGAPFRRTEFQAAIAKQIVSAAEDAVGPGCCVIGCVRKIIPDAVGELSSDAWREQKTLRRVSKEFGREHMSVHPALGPKRIQKC